MGQNLENLWRKAAYKQLETFPAADKDSFKTWLGGTDTIQAIKELRNTIDFSVFRMSSEGAESLEGKLEKQFDKHRTLLDEDGKRVGEEILNEVRLLEAPAEPS